MICVKDDDFHPLSMQPLALLLVFLFLFFALSIPIESNFDSSTMFFSVAARFLLLGWDSVRRTLRCSAIYVRSIYVRIYFSTFPFPSLILSQTLPLTLGLHPSKITIIIKSSTIESFAAFHAHLLATSLSVQFSLHSQLLHYFLSLLGYKGAGHNSGKTSPM